MAPSSPPPAAPVAMAPVDSGVAGSMPRAGSGAGPAPHANRVSLIDHNAWLVLGPDEDPFEDRPDAVECAEQGVKPEELGGEIAFGVDTGPCRYITARQVSRQYVAAGETLVVRLWHFQLNAPSPAEAHAVVQVDGMRVLDQRVPIPAPGGLIKVALPVDRAVPAGAPIYFHLHNHGENSWALVEVSTGP